MTAKNLVGSFHDPERYTTIEYPEVKQQLPENFRNFPFLVCEDAADPMGTLRCVACQICENECPPKCIYIVMDRDEKGKALKRPKVFDIDTAVCMSCQICVEVCPFDAIKMDQHYEVVATNRFQGLLLNREQLAKSNAYYHQIHPTEAAAVDAILAQQKARQAAAKAAKAAAVGGASRPDTSATNHPSGHKAPPTSQPPAAPSAEAPKPPPPAA